MIIRATLAVLCATLVLTPTAEARQRHKPAGLHPDCNILFPCTPPSASTPDQVRLTRGKFIARELGFGAPVERRAVRAPMARQHVSYAGASLGNNLVSQARAYIGTNPTGWRHLWCGRFVAMVAPQAAAKVRNPNLAKAYLALPRTSGNVGDLAVMGRRGGGHVGIVSGFDSSGNPIIVSGNAGGGIVREGVYARGRILAFVSGG